MNAKKGVVSGPKRQLKEKIIQNYENLFKGEKIQNLPQFWNDFFLLKPKPVYIDNEIQRMSQEQLVLSKPNINLLISSCIEALSDENNIRVVYSMQTLCTVIYSMFKKSECESDFTMGFENSEDNIQKLLKSCQGFLEGDVSDVLKGLSLKLLLILTAKREDINQNTLVEHVMNNTSLFECLLKLLCETQTRQNHGYDVVLLLTLLVNYRKFDAVNPNQYIVKLSILDDELALNGYGQVITSSLCDFCNQFNKEINESQHSSWLSSFTNMVGNIFISEEGGLRTQQIRANNAYLLAFYEAIHLNRNFIATLAHTQIESSSPPSPINTLNAGSSPADMSAVVNSQPSNLLVIFFQYCSIVMQDTKSEEGANTVKLCFLILCCITEDQYANSLMHDVGLAFKVFVHRVPMRHRKVSTDHTTSSQPLVCSLLDLLVEFFISHLMKKFPIELYTLAIGVLQRILCYQKRCRIRLNYVWKDLWSALLQVLRFLIQNENNLAKKMNIFNLSMRIINIFNFFITYGDTFLPTPGSYDELYYELIRVQQTFEDLLSMGLRYSMSGEYKDDALKLNNSLVNVRSIIKHFKPKVDDWLRAANLSTPSEQQILEVVRTNYDSLTLKLQDSLDQYDRYSEKPQYVSFFNHMVKIIILNTSCNIGFTLSELQKNDLIAELK